MRIAHVIIAGSNVADTNRHDMQGLGRHVLNLAVAQKARGLNPVVITSAEGIIEKALQGEGIPVVIMQRARPNDHPRPNEITLDLTAQIEKFDVQLIHCHNLTGIRAAVPLANQIGIPCVLTVHKSDVRPLRALYEAAKRQGLKFSMISVSRRELDNLRENGISEADLNYVPNGTRSLAVHEVHGPHYPDLTLVGRVAVSKGADVAILAMAELRRRLGPDVPVLNVYGADSGKYFEEMVHAVGLDDIVRFHGFKLDVIEHCDSRDILVMPSRSETGPLVVLEAMSRGMPIVATEVGDVTEMLPDPRYGRVVRPDSIVALADGIESLLKDIAGGHFDPSLVIERHRSRYTVEKMAEDVETVYKQILVNNNPC